MSWYRMKRGWMDNDFFQEEAYNERTAWSWMIGEAQWKDGIVNILGKPVLLKRGQLSDSIRFMAKKFKWSKSKVEHFLKRLEKWDMIRTDRRTGQLIITICNYSKYQDGQDTKRDSDGTANKTATGHEQDKQEEGKEVKKVKKNKARPATRPENVSENIWDDFISQRKKIFTETALRGIEREVAKAGITLEAGLRKAAERGWQSFEADWVRKNENTKSNHNGNGGKSISARADEAVASGLAESLASSENGADSPYDPPMLRHLGDLREDPGAVESSYHGYDRRLEKLPH